MLFDGLWVHLIWAAPTATAAHRLAEIFGQKKSGPTEQAKQTLRKPRAGSRRPAPLLEGLVEKKVDKAPRQARDTTRFLDNGVFTVTVKPRFPHAKELTMKRHALFAALMVSVLSMQPVLAVDAHHPDQKAGVAAPTADQTIQKMQANTKRMQSQLEQMAKSKDPNQRQKLLQEHMQTMQENMMAGKSMMGGMMDCPMMKDGMMGGGMGTLGGDDMMAKRMEMMEKRMDMMQMMIQTNMGKPQGDPENPAK